MHLLFNFLFVLFLFLNFGCQQNVGSSANSSQSLVIEESLFGNELKMLSDSESNLKTLGLEFKKISTVEAAESNYVWNSENWKSGAQALNSRTSEKNPAGITEDSGVLAKLNRADLQKFVDLGTSFLARFANPFYVRLEKDKTLLLRQIKSDFKMDLAGKIKLAKQSL